MKYRIIAILAFAGMMAFLPASALANGVSYNFGGCPSVGPCIGAIGSSASYVSKGLTITATGYSAPHKLNKLFIKHGGGDETGLGLKNQRDNEIQPGTFIQLNMSSLAAAGIDKGLITLGSVQHGEGYEICQSSVAGVLGGSCVYGHLDGKPTAFSWSSADPYISITATTGDVLLAKSVSVPEASSVMLLGSGLLALVGLTLRKKAIA